MNISDIKNKSVAILGFGKEGQSTLKFLQEQGIGTITILDKQDIDISSFIKENLAKQGEINSISGESYLDNLEDFDVIFKSPGICPFQEKLKDYRDKFVSQTQIFFENYRGKVIGITGTKGKSTISTLLYECLLEAGYDVKLVGNIGKPVLDEIDIFSGNTYDFVIYEMSSFMLQDFTPKLDIAFLNNIYPCHLDWHGSMTIYARAKYNILKDAEYSIINGDLIEEIKSNPGVSGKKIFFNSVGKYLYTGAGFSIDNDFIYGDNNIALQGKHNRENISGVMAILDTIFQDINVLKKIFSIILPKFSGLENRIEDIGRYEGIRFINDAIATTPESTLAAIDTFGEELQTLFLGGEDSGFHFGKLRKKILRSTIQNIIAFPDTVVKIFPEIQSRDYEIPFEIEIEGKSLQIIKTRSMKTGVDFAYKTTFPGKIALLSCAAPSFSLWRNYLEKAEEFKKEVIGY